MTRLVTQCGSCGSRNLEPVLKLGISPPTCAMVPVGATAVVEKPHPLDLLHCSDCTLVQLSVIVDPGEVFPPNYPYSSGNSPALHENFRDLAGDARKWFGGLLPRDLVVDIGANDGTLLSKFSRSCRTIGVEPTRQAHRITGAAYREFFTEQLARKIREQHGPAKVVTACNVLAHVEDIDDVLRGITILLADDGILIAENHDLASVVDGRQWDTVYHEHLRFYSPYSFSRLLGRHGFRVGSWRQISTHGGSFRMLADRSSGVGHVPRREYDFPGLARDAAVAREAIRDAVHDGAVGIGATARATTIINYCNLNVIDLKYVCEVAGSDKIGRYIPGTHIPVVDESVLFGDDQPARAVLFSWHLADVIVPKLRDRGYRGEIILPLPTLTIA